MESFPDFKARKREVALERLRTANERKARMWEVRRLLQNREVEPGVLLAGDNIEWEDAVSSAKIERALLWIPGIGKSTMFDICYELGLRPQARLRDLSTEQRQDLGRAVRLCLGSNL